MKRTENQEYRLHAEDAQRLNNLKQNVQNGDAESENMLNQYYKYSSIRKKWTRS